MEQEKANIEPQLLQIYQVFGELLSLQPESIPESTSCAFCGRPTRQEVIEYTARHHIGEVEIAVTKLLPGYSCDNTDCGAQFLDPTLDDSFLDAVGEGFAKMGDPSFKEQLQTRRDQESIVANAAFSQSPPEE